MKRVNIAFLSTVSLLLLLMVSPSRANEIGANSSSRIDPIKEVKKIEVEKAAFDGKRAADQPIVIKDEKTAKKYFNEKQLKKLMKEVDLEKQYVLVFAWRGSGRDQLEVQVMESYPEQIAFKLVRGRTRDLRSHVKVYAVRANVKMRTP